jgi:hypothetical protein
VRRPRRRWNALAAASIVCAALLGSRPCLAGDPAKEAEALHARGNAAIASGRPADALADYEAAYRLKPRPALLYNQARAHQALTNYATALTLLERFEREASPELRSEVSGLSELLAELRDRIHTLTLPCNVAGAEVRLGDRILGKTPFSAPLVVNAGDSSLVVQAPGYRPFQRQVSLRRGASSTVEVALEREDRTGILVVRSPHEGAAVSVDGTRRGTVPLELRMEPGTHRIELVKDGYEPARTTMVVVAGERTGTDVTLEAKPGLLSKWWFWTAVGVVVAGGVGTYIALTTERSADAGTIPPGQVTIASSQLARF